MLQRFGAILTSLLVVTGLPCEGQSSTGTRIRGLNNFDTIAPVRFDPNYFTYGYTDHQGASAGQDVKFQISVKTKIFRGAKGGWGWANGLTFAYTQLSIFDINGRSSPFRATNYNPDVLFVWDRATHVPRDRCGQRDRSAGAGAGPCCSRGCPELPGGRRGTSSAHGSRRPSTGGGALFPGTHRE